MRTHLAIWLLAVAPVVALAQAETPGIDLSQPPPAEPDKGESEELPPIDLSKPAEPAQPATPPARDERREEKKEARPTQPFSDKDVALGDKVKAVQRKGFMKRGRFEIAPMLATTANDAFYQKVGGGLRLGYNLQDSFEIAARWAKYTQVRTDYVVEGKRAFSSQLLSSQMYDQLMLDGIWSPIYGKAAFLGRSIVHFDVFLQAGFGLVHSASSEPPLEKGVLLYSMDLGFLGKHRYRGHLATEIGGGVRFYPREWMAFEMGLLATFYPDQTAQALPATVQRVFVANVGVAFFYPFTFEYVYP
jgi:outer membrane beta-barrel protein